MTEDEADARVQHAVKQCAAYTLALEQTNIQLLRWQSVACDAHVDHLCKLIRSLAVSDETPRTLRDLSAMGVEEEVRRIVLAERVNREKSEQSAREWKKKAEDAEAALLDDARRRVVSTVAQIASAEEWTRIEADAARFDAIIKAATNLCELMATRDPQFLSGLEDELMRACGAPSRFSR